MVAALTAGAAGLAGCTADEDDLETDDTENGNGNGNGDGDTDDSSDPGDGDPIKDTFKMEIPNPAPNDVQFNRFNPSGRDGLFAQLYHDRLAAWSWESEEFIPMFATDWEFESDDLLRLDLSEIHTWHSGDPIVADDLVVQMELERAFGDPLWEFIEGVRAAGDHTLEIDLQEGVNQSLLLDTLFNDSITDDFRYVHAPESVYGEYVERLEDGEETDSVTADLVTTAFRDLDNGSGPFEVVAQDSQGLVWEKYEEYENQHITADDINFEAYEATYAPDRQAELQLLLEQELDGSRATGEQSAFEPVFENYDFVPAPTQVGVAVNFNHEDPVYGLPKVRQAIAHIMDREQVNANEASTDPQKEHNKWITGMFNDQVEMWVDDPSIFNTYDQDWDRAAELLEEVGFHEEDGEWQGEVNGETLEATVYSPGFWTNMAQTAVSHMQEFGLPVELATEEPTNIWGDIAPSGSFRMMMWIWGDGGHPFSAYSAEDVGLRQYDSYGNYPEEWTAPPLPDGDDNDVVVNVPEYISGLPTASEEEARQMIKELAWVFNQNVVYAPVHEWSEIFWFDRENWNFPAEDDSDLYVDRPFFWPLKRGKMSARTR